MEQNTNKYRLSSTSHHKKLQTRINRIVGQTEGIQRMVFAVRYEAGAAWRRWRQKQALQEGHNHAHHG